MTDACHEAQVPVARKVPESAAVTGLTAAATARPAESTARCCNAGYAGLSVESRIAVALMASRRTPARKPPEIAQVPDSFGPAARAGACTIGSMT